MSKGILQDIAVIIGVVGFFATAITLIIVLNRPDQGAAELRKACLERGGSLYTSAGLFRCEIPTVQQ